MSKRIFLTMVTLAAFLFGCRKAEVLLEPIYEDAPATEISFLEGNPSPAQGGEGTEVTFMVKGLKNKEGNFRFLIGDLEAEVLSVADSSIKVKIPVDAVSGGAVVYYEDKYFFGPEFKVRGNVAIDPAFIAFNGANGPLYDIAEVSTGKYIIAGDFTNYENAASASLPVRGLARIGSDGSFLTGERMAYGDGPNGAVYDIMPLSYGGFLISGAFNEYNERSGFTSVTRIQSTGELDSTIVTLINPDPITNPNDNTDTVSTFNGGVVGTVLNTYEQTSTQQTILVGNFFTYNSTFYERSTKTAKIIDRVLVNQIVRLNQDGSLDSSFSYDLSLHRGLPGGNGNITGSVRIPGGRILLTGNFTSFHGKQANGLVCIRESDGTVDETFNDGGSGANNTVSGITFNATTGKILIYGSFNTYNGTPVNGVVMLTQDGSIDPSFVFRATTGGRANFVGQLNNGKIIVSGGFATYDSKVRPGFMVLRADGSLSPGDNNTGAFVGTVHKMLEIRTSLRYPGVILVGNFNTFDNTEVHNIVQLQILE